MFYGLLIGAFLGALLVVLNIHSKEDNEQVYMIKNMLVVESSGVFKVRIRLKDKQQKEILKLLENDK